MSENIFYSKCCYVVCYIYLAICANEHEDNGMVCVYYVIINIMYAMGSVYM